MEILPGIHSIPGIRWSRVYLIEDDTLTLVDSGFPWNARRVLHYIRSIGRRPTDLRLILITHSHPDHASGALAVSRLTEAEIAAHGGDTKSHADHQVSLSYMKVFTSLSLPVPFLQRTPVGHIVTDGQVLPILGGMRVIHTPGHTPGSVCYLLEDRGLIFSGDTLFSDGERLSRSVPFPGSNGQHLRRSLKALAALEFDTLCGGHGVPLVGGASDKLRELLSERPDPPSWSQVLRGIPERLYNGRALLGE